MSSAQQAGLAATVKRRLGRVGVWSSLPGRLSAREAAAFTRGVEAMGYPALWMPENATSKESLVNAALLLAASERIVLATGITSIYGRDAAAAINAARALVEAHPGRFVLGLGVSHAPSVRQRGHIYDRPLAAMRQYLDAMDATTYAAPAADEPVPVVLAALGPQMLRLSAQRTLGAHPYFVPVEHTRQARETMGPDALLAVEIAAVLETDPEQGRAAARAYLPPYLRLENYTGNLRRLGWTDADLANGGSDRLAEAIVAWGDVAAIAARVRAHLEAGADHVCVNLLDDPARPTLEQLRQVAPALLAL